MPTFLDRYNAGDVFAVWSELHAIEDARALDRPTRLDVEAVAAETMDRALRNLRVISKQLHAVGFVFEHAKWAQPSNPHGPKIADVLKRQFEFVPPVLAAWLERVSCVSFLGDFPAHDGAWRKAKVDPFEFATSRDEAESDIETWQDRGDPFELCFAGDTFHKNDISGGPPTNLRLPASTVDVRVYESAEQIPAGTDGMWFVDYLRRYFLGGGFCTTKISEANARQLLPTITELVEL